MYVQVEQTTNTINDFLIFMSSQFRVIGNIDHDLQAVSMIKFILKKYLSFNCLDDVYWQTHAKV